MSNYDLTTLSLGGGVQSSTLCQMITEGELPPVDCVIFADTGDEPQHTYDHVDYLAIRLKSKNIPLHIVDNGNMVKDIYKEGRFAAMPLFTKITKETKGFGVTAYNEQVGRLKRQCTSEYKIVPIERKIRQLLLEKGKAKQRKNGAIFVNKGVKVQTVLGISWDEVSRIKPSRTSWINHVWPLVDKRITRQMCKDWLKVKGLPIPRKSSCKRCPYHNKKYWIEMRDNEPKDWEEVILFDQDLRNGKLKLSVTAKGEVFMTRKCVPLSEIDLTTAEEAGQLAFDFCDEGYCFI